jgi:hypothetical protein
MNHKAVGRADFPIAGFATATELIVVRLAAENDYIDRSCVGFDRY